MVKILWLFNLSFVSLAAMIPDVASFAAKELDWLALNGYHECRGCSYDAQIAVAQVTLQRVQSQRYPTTVEAVVKQPAQFSWYWDGRSDKPKNYSAWSNSRKVALDAMRGESHDDIRCSLWYHTIYITPPKWTWGLVVVAVYGDHMFYCEPEDIRT